MTAAANCRRSRQYRISKAKKQAFLKKSNAGLTELRPTEKESQRESQEIKEAGSKRRRGTSPSDLKMGKIFQIKQSSRAGDITPSYKEGAKKADKKQRLLLSSRKL
ncbi:MAG: hypothetical protein II655_02550 [Thermoguttaceae bacterium]|nr:hypothetical protein [Thermoguttaceae bacterium]MBQ4202560.1 hypothetical protein [Thermoguttaceae bacterium]